MVNAEKLTTVCTENRHTVGTRYVEAMQILIRIGLTRKQATVYARWYSGWTHERIAEHLGVERENVTRVIARALRRIPSLPRPPRHRRFRVVQLSQVAPVQL